MNRLQYHPHSGRLKLNMFFLPWQKCIQTIQKKHKIVLGPEYQLWDLIIIIQMDLFNWDVINDRSIIIYLFPS